MNAADPPVTIRPAREADLDAVARVHRLAFGTFFGLPDPTKFRADADTVRTRYRTDPALLFVADVHGAVIGSVIGMHWGSAGILGPITVHPDWWSKGIARLLMPAMVAEFDRRGVGFVGLFTHPQSTRHIRLYETYGFWPAAMTAVMEKPVGHATPDSATVSFSTLDRAARAAALDGCRAVADRVHRGLDLGREIEHCVAQGIGDGLLLYESGAIAGFAVCHIGAGSEAGGGTFYVKFAVVSDSSGSDGSGSDGSGSDGSGADGAGAGERFSRLLAAAEAAAATAGQKRLVAGCNANRHDAYRRMRDAGYRSFMNGIAMFRPHAAGYNRAGVYVADDWR
ncbi:MAG: GNAT family N-acetyltransferase [Alphaproteobacteria bacterium]|nr:GNAT family N-acetyltransferase [Alphaproteobacteria bacterium]